MQCMYAASDLAGTMKLQYDVTSRIIRMVFVSAAEGDKFADEIRAIGPNPIRL